MELRPPYIAASVLAVLLGTASARAVIIWTDIPDTTIGSSAPLAVDLGAWMLMWIGTGSPIFMSRRIGTMKVRHRRRASPLAHMEPMLRPCKSGANTDPPGFQDYTANIAAGSQVGGSLTWSAVSYEPMFYYNELGYNHGGWPGTGFIGVALAKADGLHYGWIRTSSNFSSVTTIFEVAYETSPGVPIVAGATPSPASVSLLAVWAVGGLACPRCRRSSLPRS